jgi:hypothetical protein
LELLVDRLADSVVLSSHRDRISTIEFWSNGVVFMSFDDNKVVELEDSIRQYELLKSHYDGIHKLKVLVEPGANTSLSKEAREFSGRPEHNEMTAGTAVIVKSLAQRLIVNFLINFIRKQKMKMRMFENREEAIDWLLALTAAGGRV